uniref:ORF2 n=1 Tax=Giant panda anellovirus TaxID=2016460 RepID=A0A220IGN0_9VIRU|nr:ORF2 [Giant panda anellovirus]
MRPESRAYRARRVSQMGSPAENIWLESIKLSHQLFCNCGNFKQHLQKIWSGSTEDGTTDAGDPIPDDIMVAFDLGFEDTAGENLEG